MAADILKDPFNDIVKNAANTPVGAESNCSPLIRAAAEVYLTPWDPDRKLPNASNGALRYACFVPAPIDQSIADRAREWVNEHYPELTGKEYDEKLAGAYSDIAELDLEDSLEYELGGKL